MQMPGRVFSSASYRYGFNGKENDNDVKGNGSQQDYGERVYDTRLGRFLSTDPLTKSYPMLTPYQYASNSPIWMIDLDGLEGVKFSDFWNGKAHILQFLSDPDIKGTAFETTQSFNRNYNPVFKVNNYALKLRTGSDYDGNPIDSRGKTGVIADFGVEALMWLTLIKLQAPKANQPVEVQLTQQAKALGNARPKPTQVAGEEMTASSSAQTVSQPTSKFLGGAKGKLKSMEGVLEGNHLPTMNSFEIAGFKISYNKASAFQMLYEEHRAFISTGRTAEAIAFRQKEAALLLQGKFLEAFDLNAQRIVTDYGSKYNEALGEARKYFQESILPMLEKQLKK